VRRSRRRALGVAAACGLALVLVPAAVPPAQATPTAPVGGPRLGSTGLVLAPGVKPPPNVGASWVAVDLDTGVIFGAKGPHVLERPASTLKTLTALVLLPILDPKTVYTATDADVRMQGTRVGMVAGATYTVDQLFQAMLLPSANDASHGLEMVAGGTARTVALMTAEARYLQADDTTIKDPSGLDTKGQWSSAYDLALFGRAAMQLPAFRAYVIIPRSTFPGRPPKTVGKPRSTFVIENKNRLVLSGYPGIVGVKTGYTTDADALQSLLMQTEHPLLEHLLHHRDVSRLKTVVDSLIPMIDEHGRVHTTFNQLVAATGRLSSTDPNLQNIPIRTAEGRRIRQAFVVGSGYESLMTADYSQIEMRIMADLSGDDALVEAFGSGFDFHATTAASVFGVPLVDVDGVLRNRVKAMNYGLAYGLSAYGLSQQLGISADEARGLMVEYFERFGGVRDYLARVVAQARQDGYTETILGRRRYLPDLNSDNRQRREMAERMALNAPIQGSAADIIKVAMLNVDRALRAAGLKSRMLLQVHDELVFEIARGERAPVEVLVRREMAGAYPLKAPLNVSVGVGPTWDSAGH